MIFLLSNVFFKLKQTKSIKTHNSDTEKTNYKCDHCNIVLIDIDVLRADELPCYGYFRNTTPNLCSWAKKSLVFKNNFSTASWTLPSAFSTITSLYPTFHKIEVAGVNILDKKISTLAETLKKDGYYNIYIGPDLKNSALLSTENGGLRGYDLITGDNNLFDAIKNAPKDKPWFIHFYDGTIHMPYLIEENQKVFDENMKPPKNFPVTNSEFANLIDEYLRKNYKDVFTKKAIDENSQIILSKKQDKNDLKVFNFFDKLPGTDKETIYLKETWKPIYNTYMATFDSTNKTDVDYVKMMYDTKLNLLDGYLKNIFEMLTTSENTVTIVMSDHGESFGEHGTFSHDENYHTELFYTPLIINSPKIENKIIEQTTSNIDIFPTILDILNVPKISELQGKSLIGYAQGLDIGTSRFVFSESRQGLILQNKDWLYFLPNLKVQEPILYNKKNDPTEKKNTIFRFPELANYLYNQANILRSYKNQTTTDSVYTIPNNLKPEKIEKLKKEGYF